MSQTTANAGPHSSAEEEALATMLANLRAEGARWAETQLQDDDEEPQIAATRLEVALILGLPVALLVSVGLSAYYGLKALRAL